TVSPFSSYGTASDAVSVTNVQYRVVFNNVTSAWASVTSVTLTNPAKVAPWTNNLVLSPGTNIVQYRAFDLSGNDTTNLAPSTKKVFMSAAGVYSLVTNGIGDVKGTIVAGDDPSISGAALKIGRAYTVEAKLKTTGPGVNYLFSNWVAVVNGGSPLIVTNKKYTFTMASNVVLTANFITNNFVGAAGTYYGLFSDTLGVAHQGAGWFKIKTDS